MIPSDPLPPTPDDLWPTVPLIDWHRFSQGAEAVEIALVEELCQAVVSRMTEAGRLAAETEAWSDVPSAADVTRNHSRKRATDAAHLHRIYEAIHEKVLGDDTLFPTPDALRETATRAYRGALRDGRQKHAKRTAYNDTLYA